jgi:hypothetical protein
MTELSLHPDHLTDLRKSGLTDKTILEAGIKSVSPDLINKKIGYNIQRLISAYEIPYPDTDFYRYKVFYDEGIRGKPKYLQRKNTGNRLYIPPEVRPLLSNPALHLCITEGEKKALKTAQEGLPCIALSGLWNWSNGTKELIPDFDLIALEGRTVYIIPDNDWLQPNKHGYRKNLKQAVYQLAERLKHRGAKVFIIELPQGKLKGLDDYLCNYTTEEFKALPVIEVKSLPERIIEATQKNYNELLPEIADLDDEIQKEILCKALSKKIDVNYRIIKSAVKVFEKGKEPVITDNNIIIAHPSYDIKNDFMVLGFRETIVSGNEPEDRNFYIISTNEGFRLHDNKILQLQDKNIIFDERERFLLRAEDRWHKEKILSFIKQPVSPLGLYQEIKQILQQYIELQKDSIYGLVAAWIIATYFFLTFHAFPFLFIYGKKQSGKSRLLDLLERLAFNAMKIKGVSVASMTDSIDGVKGTFLNDQAEALSDSRNAELLGILADSYTIGGGKRRIVDISNKRRRVVEFGTYAPKVFASIREIDPDLKDRCIEINMLRAFKDYPYPEAYLPIWHNMRDKLYRLLLTKWREVKQIYETTGEGVTQRVKELWRPIETVLTLENVSTGETQDIKGFFLESMQQTQSELSDSEHEFFEILLETTKKTGETILTVDDITRNMKTRPREDMTDKGLQTWAGRILRQFSLYDRQEGRRGRRRAYHFSYDRVKDIFCRYHLTGGIGGQVGNILEIKDKNEPTYVLTGGNEVGHAFSYPTYDPPIKKEVVSPKALNNKGIAHLPTSTTYPEEEEPIIIEGVKA